MQYTQTTIDQEMSADQQQPPARRLRPSDNHNPAAQNNHPHHQPPPPQKCPRCDSSNTKFCYYNNYSLSQPRYFCKACRRYWTHGGTLRNVPVGGGCRKSKRPKPSNPSSSSAAGENIGRSQPLPAALPPQNLTAMIPPAMGGSFYSGGSFLSSLAAMQSLSSGISQRPAALNLGGQFDANMALHLQPMKTPAMPQQQFHGQNEFFASQQRPIMGSWTTQSFMNRGTAPTSAGTSGFWGGGAADGGDNQAAGSSFNPNNWPENHHPGFDPSQ